MTSIEQTKGRPEGGADAVTEAVLGLEARRCAAIAAGDLEALADVLADDYVHVFGTGATTDRSGYLKTIGSSPRVPERGPLTVHRLGDAGALVTGSLLNRIARPGKEDLVVEAIATQVAVHQAGVWRFVSIQLTPVRVRAA